jgi:hypothetical protein
MDFEPYNKGGGMKKKITSLSSSCGLAFLMLVQIAGASTPVSQIGSNPYFTTQLFPQDLLLRQGNYLYYYPNYRDAPWWGDIDEPANKPQSSSVDYTVTGVDIIDNNANFKHTGSMQTIGNNFGYACELGNNLAANLEVNYIIDALRNSASGTMTSSEEYTKTYHGTLPFEYSNRHTLNRLSIQGMVGSMYRDIPVGIKVNGGFQNTLSLKKEISFSKLQQLDSAGDVFDSNSIVNYHFEGDQAHAFWGWNTSPCNHIFNIPGPQGDSWSEDWYSIGPLYHFDVLAAMTLPKVKAGLYYRLKRGHQDQYQWDANPIDPANKDIKVQQNFIGQYKKMDYTLVRSAWEARAFGNVNHRSHERYSLNTFVSLGYIDSSITSALSSNPSVPTWSKPRDAIRSLCLEADPNINIRFGEGLNFLDAAILFDYRYSRYSNTSEQSIQGGGMERGYNSSNVNGRDEDMWENFSYANENSLHLGAETNMMFPVYTAYPHHLSLGLMFVGNVKFTRQTKYYGSSNQAGGELDFSVANRRFNYQREVWFNTFLMAHYVQGPLQLRFEVTEPILYSILPSTKITDAKGKNLSYEHVKSPLWISQLGMQAGVYASYDFVMPFLQGLRRGN